MAQAGGSRRGQLPNQYAVKRYCECGPSRIPDALMGDCVKCGHHIAGMPIRGFEPRVHPAPQPARGATHRARAVG